MKKAAVMLLILASCGQPSSKVDYHVNGGQTVTINDPKNGSVKAEMGASAKMPTDLPAWAPAYPGSTVMMAQNQTGTPGGPLENVMLQSPDDLAKVSAFYDAKIAQAGVKLMHTASGPDVSTRMAETATGVVSVAVSKDDDGGSTISITRMPKS